MKNESYKTQEERLRYLIRAMQKEMPQYRGIVIPEDSAGQKQLIRSLMNVRPPMPADPEFLAEQDLYLSEENAARGILLRQIQILFRQELRICRHRRPYVHQGADKLFLPRTILRNHYAAILRHLLLHSPDQIPEAFFLGLVTLIFQITSPL